MLLIEAAADDSPALQTRATIQQLHFSDNITNQWLIACLWNSDRLLPINSCHSNANHTHT